jgi:hypothetical protein
MNDSSVPLRNRLDLSKQQAGLIRAPQYLLGAEDQILEAIARQAPLPTVLNLICGAVDSKIGNICSLIFLRGSGRTNLSTIADEPERFGLHTYVSIGILSAGGEELGSLRILCCYPRLPRRRELQLISWAMRLAALSICLDRRPPRSEADSIRVAEYETPHMKTTYIN